MATLWRKLRGRNLADTADEGASSQLLKDIGRLESYHGPITRTKAVSKLRRGSENCHLIRYSIKHKIFRVSVKYFGDDDKAVFKHYNLSVTVGTNEENIYSIDGTGKNYTDITELLNDYEDFSPGHECHGIGKGIRKKTSNTNECQYRPSVRQRDRSESEINASPRDFRGEDDAARPIFSCKPDLAELTVMKWGRVDVTGEIQRFRLVEKISGDWVSLSVRLGQGHRVDNYRQEDSNNVERAISIFKHWIDNGYKDYPLTWNRVIELLGDMGKKNVAQELKDVLSKKEESIASH